MEKSYKAFFVNLEDVMKLTQEDFYSNSSIKWYLQKEKLNS
jgi:hypothetical protein